MKNFVKFANRTLVAILISLSCTNFGMYSDEELEEANIFLLAGARDGKMYWVEQGFEQGANVDATDLYGYTPLMYAAESGHPTIVKRLLQAKANFNAADSVGRTALMLAAMNGNTEIVELLLQAGANPHAVDKNGEKALDYALYQNHTNIIDRLQAVAPENISMRSSSSLTTNPGKIKPPPQSPLKR